MQALIQLSTNDTLTCLIQNNTNADNILVSSLNFTPTSIGGTSNVTNDQVVISWDGSTNQVAVTAGTNMDITAGVISTTAEPNVVTEWNGSTAPVQVTAGTDIDITNGIISYTGGGGGGGPSGNYQLFEMTQATQPNQYTLGAYLSVVTAGQGDKNINPGQLNIGEQAILEFTFALEPVNVTTEPVVSGNFRWTFGPYFYDLADMSLVAPIAPRHGTLKYTVTRINQTEVTIDVNGYYINSAGEFIALLGNPALVPNTFAYNQNNTYLMEIEYIPNAGTAQQYLGVEVSNYTVEQHTSRTGGGGSGGIVTEWDGSTAPVQVTAGAGIDITNGVITNTGGGGGGAQSGNFNIGTCLVPRTSFQYGVYQSIIDQLQGTQTIAPASLAVGESVKMRFTYELNPTLPTLSTISGSFQYVFGNTILNPPPNLNLILSNTSQRTGFVEYTVTRTAVGEVTLDATGWYIKTNPLDFSGTMPVHTGLFTTTLPYDENLSYLFDVQWAYVSGDVNNYLDVKALNLMIDQHTQRVGAGGTQVVESWNGGTAPVDVTAGTLMDITNGVISTTAEQNVVTTWDGSSAPLAVTAGTGISIAGGVISTTGSTFQQYFLDAICIDPRGRNTQYTPNTFETVWVTLAGPAGGPVNNVPALAQGNSVQIRCSGILNSVTSGGTGQLRLTFGSVFTITSPTIDFLATSITRNFDLNITITNLTGTDVQCSVAGGYFDKNNVYKSWDMVVTPSLQPYTPSVQTLDLEWNPNVGPGNFFDFLALNLVIERLYIQ